MKVRLWKYWNIFNFTPPMPCALCFSDGASREENAAKLLKVAWLTLPLGIFITIGACFFVLWWQGLSYSNPYAQAIFINGTFLIIYWLFSNTMLSWFKNKLFMIQLNLYGRFCMRIGAPGWTFVYTFSELASSQTPVGGWNCGYIFPLFYNVHSHC